MGPFNAVKKVDKLDVLDLLQTIFCYYLYAQRIPLMIV